ncbi:MAG: ABC transporter substrate-binding protein [Cyclobacteriaceae bacterium]|nr:ABC transporter substrate-binding protein [Cyclobacteriaceae bacterium]
MLRYISVGLFFCMWIACGPAGNDQTSQHQEGANAYQMVTDMRGKEVRLPLNPSRVVSISDGLIETVLMHFDKIEVLKGLGSYCIQNRFSYSFSKTSGTEYTYADGMNPVLFLYPEIAELPLIARSGIPVNYEAMATLQPDLVILRAGSCTMRTFDDENTQKAIQMIEAMGFPLIVLKGPPCYDEPSVDMIRDEIVLLGEIFHKQNEAKALADYLEGIISMIKVRTKDISDDKKPDVLMLGLSPNARSGGNAGVTKGSNTMEGYFIESIVNARNAYQGTGGRSSSLLLNTEQIYALDPDVIILPTSSGYHPPEELYTAPYYANLSKLQAVKNRRVYALPWTPCNCGKRIEYPVEVLIIAKASYPELFEDIVMHEWVLDFYSKVYNTSRVQSEKIRDAQWLNWMQDEGF